MSVTERAAPLEDTLARDLQAAAVQSLTRLHPEAGLPAHRRRGWLVRRALVLADLLGLSLAFLIASAVAAGPAVSRLSPEAEGALFLVTLPLWVVVAKLYGLYDRDEDGTDHSTVDEVSSVFHLVTVGAWLLLATTWLTGLAQPELKRLVVFWMLATVGISFTRALARAYCRRRPEYVQRAVIVGAGEVGQLIAHKLLQHPEYGIEVAGFVDAEPRALRAGLDGVPLLGGPDDLPEVISSLGIARVVVAFSGDSHEDSLALVRSLKSLDVHVDIVPRLFEIVGARVAVHSVEGLPLLGLPRVRLSRSSRLLKRVLDVTLATGGLLGLAPLLALVACAIKLGSPGPVLFRQVRMGAGGHTFRIYKFRTMVADAESRKANLVHLNMHARNGGDPRMFKLPDDPRVTPLGRLLRRYSLDELPQLVNVIRGEMSLVGPRPLILDEDRHVRAWARERLRLKPGITGPWQVLGASDIPFEEMVKLDYLYVTTWSLRNDLSLILKTFPFVLRERSAW